MRVAVFAEDPLVASGLVALLGLEADFSVSGEGSAFVVDASALRDAELVLWDVASGAAATRQSAALERFPTLALVRDEESALEVMRAGALGLLPRNADSERVLAALRAVATGLRVFDPTLLRGVLRARTAPPETLFTPRETEVLGLMAEGLSNKLIADRLKISDHTAKFHVNAILSKLGAETRTEAVVSAARRGLLML